MAIERWKVTYKIVKVNGEPHVKAPDLIREHVERVPSELQRAAEQLADWGDFALVEVVANSLDSTERFRFTFESDDGYQKDWQTGRQ